MRIKGLFAALAIGALSACTGSLETDVSENAAAPGEGWTMQVLGTEANQIYVVTGPDGKTAAARVQGGVSAMIPDGEAQTLMSEAQTAFSRDLPDEKVSIAAPGVSIKVAGDESVEGGRGSVRIAVGGVSIDVDGDDSSGDGRGTVRIAGVDGEAAHKFIDEAEGLSPDVKRQMREKLGI
jgi:hypothetical protein